MRKHLATIAQNVLSIPASRAAIERLFHGWICDSRMENEITIKLIHLNDV